MSVIESDNSSSAEEEYIFYRDRPDWKDLTPIPQDDGPHPVVKIAYTDAFQDVYDYFRAIVARGELSERALLLTEDAIQMNAANYTVWQYRRKIIKHINYDLKKEIDFCREMIEINPKNYQVWHHRRVIVEWLGDPSKELLFTRIIFNSDAKNYHAWEHRQWVLIFLMNELDYVEELIQEDIRNNSAWNQRYFVISRTTGFTEDVIKKEINYTKAAIEKLGNNESSWNYLKGILIHSSSRLSELEDLEKWCWDLYKVRGETCPFLISFLIDLLEDKMEASTMDENERRQNLEQALKLCESLAGEHDKIRREYWRFIAKRLLSKFKM
ncbi:Protein farnesyltransferase/geranylgeranyltransferase type-1 subunit alpha [Armadillidium nasatum]|uniref:Protein farnesyltransferase/geranylgeranyltransferase type-1 subunit alpha n=1 Tax=Armadillidium nasatum TaxID=96803 RepID=A0A5N5TKW4_9CRUS|nr:Protein farnesyltransferase/geranylgeranyltransferase type-1 subunit alpha [Armadillidium nasatum]